MGEIGRGQRRLRLQAPESAGAWTQKVEIMRNTKASRENPARRSALSAEKWGKQNRSAVMEQKPRPKHSAKKAPGASGLDVVSSGVAGNGRDQGRSPVVITEITMDNGLEDISIGPSPRFSEGSLVSELWKRDAGGVFDQGEMRELYFREVGRVPLLSAQEEIDLSRRIERGQKAQKRLVDGNLNTREQSTLQRIIEDGWAAREHLITANSRLVISIAKKYVNRGVPFLDLVQEGHIGMIRAAKKFNYHLGFKFSTYATWWIRQAVTRAIADQGRTIRLPVHMGDQLNRMSHVAHQLSQKLGREPSTDELAEALGATKALVEDALKVSQRPVSLESSNGDDDDTALGEFIPDLSSPSPADVVTEDSLRDDLKEILGTLPTREALALRLRFGLVDGKSYTLEEVGQKMGVTRERVRQLEAQAFRRLRLPAYRRKLSEYLTG